MITPEKIDRINFLARKAREQELTEEEKIEIARFYGLDVAELELYRTKNQYNVRV